MAILPWFRVKIVQNPHLSKVGAVIRKLKMAKLGLNGRVLLWGC